MFGRKSPAPQVVEPESPVKEVGKGRPTPSRKEAEAARKARLKQPRTRKEINAANRAQRAEQGSKMREAMKTGDERYLPLRDRGPVKRFTRDWIDARFTFAEIVLPVLILALVVPYVSIELAMYSQLFTLVVMATVIVNLVVMRYLLRKELKRRFPDADLKGTTYYAIMRAIQIRPLRLPKPQVKIGAQLPDTYR
ncbi:hypothetical protein J2S40_000965 [Nocardioides luteus]|uniref:DUF3043 domain-containing protein n=1 Tax=Nocardioides luteus TaxID=1844 RepID=A0ABQ5SUM6_9ACTN|nr:DUF3043 domain-containing protein [Nocardioides luteus]MDR7309907.1 hypothetical protein [Nocardioides luteus]GGR59652.1 hypothetical protein GCM10010197_28180 [Nocardioides luteus]GLJ67184.1 hypothetical protein GCM10017579_12200 [Nocardioides luteus]